MRLVPFVLFFLVSTLTSGVAWSHTRPLSYSFWQLDDRGANVQLQMTTGDLELLAAQGPDESPPPSLLELRAGDARCETVMGPGLVPAASPWVVWRWRVECPRALPRSITAHFVALLGDHRHLVRIEDGHGHVSDRVLDVSAPEWVLKSDVATAGASSIVGYVRLGIEHLLTGWDHVLFVLLLLLLAERLKDVVVLVTSFTVAHSLTLAAAVLGVVEPDTRPVEALIGFSIALLGAENAWLLSGRRRAVPLAVTGALGVLFLFDGAVTRWALGGLALFSACHFALLARASRPAGLRVALSFAFGLIHGFGFAAVMGELRLPSERLAAALFGFNAGVELGQLAVVVAVWPLLRALGRFREGRAARTLNAALSAAICGVGVFWFVSRCLSATPSAKDSNDDRPTRSAESRPSRASQRGAIVLART